MAGLNIEPRVEFTLFCVDFRVDCPPLFAAAMIASSWLGWRIAPWPLGFRIDRFCDWCVELFW